MSVRTARSNGETNRRTFQALGLPGDTAAVKLACSKSGYDINSSGKPVIYATDGSVVLTGDTTGATMTAATITTATLTGVTIGSATTAGRNVACLADSTSTTSGTVQNTEYTLNTVTIPANAFNANTRWIRIDFAGITAANANAKNIKLYFGATAVVTVTGSTANAKKFAGSVTIMRTGSSTQSGWGTIQVDTAVAPTLDATVALAETDTADIVIALKSANTAAADASATGYGMAVTFGN